MARRGRQTDRSRCYSAPVAAERQKRLEALYDKSALRNWALETGVYERILELIIMQVRAQEGLPTDKKTWRIVRVDEPDAHAESGGLTEGEEPA